MRRGVIVTDVADNSIAAAQGIEREDVITEVDGKPVTNVRSFREAWAKPIQSAASCFISTARAAKRSRS